MQLVASPGIERVSLPSRTVGRMSPRCIALEVVLNKGPLVAYGLLGGQFHPDDGDAATVDIWYLTDPEGPFASDLAPPSEDVRVGLPREFVDAVLRGVRRAFVLEDCPSGLLEVHCAAYGQYGSSEAVFEYLGEQLARLLTNASDDVEDRLADVLAAAP